MTFSAKSIANFFLELAQTSGVPVTPMKLQKLVYYAHGWYAGYTQKPLIDETIEAWQYGPVIESIYHEFKPCGSKPITRLATDLDLDTFDLAVVKSPTDESIRKFLQSIWNSYSKYTGTALSQMTHAPDSPWDITWKRGEGVKGLDIPQELIVKHFKEAADRAKSQQVKA